MNKFKVIVSVEDEDGNAMITSESTREVPTLDGFLEHGFRKSFGVLENAALDTRKEAIDSAVEQYLEDISKKTLHEFPRDMNIPR